jgi:hypothetical protein
MKLTKGKLIKIMKKKNQSVKKKCNKKKSSSGQRKTLRRKRKINLARKTLKRFRHKKQMGGEEDNSKVGSIENKEDFLIPAGQDETPMKELPITVEEEPEIQEPIVTDPIVSDPIVTDPIVTDPIVTDPIVTDPIVTDTIVTDTIVSDPIVTDPIVTDPIVQVEEPLITDPVVSDQENKKITEAIDIMVDYISNKVTQKVSSDSQQNGFDSVNKIAEQLA